MVRNFAVAMGGGVARAERGAKDENRSMSENKRDYEVGRDKPPVHSRFKKGQSSARSSRHRSSGLRRQRANIL
jgi:hypothetical protein